MTVKAGDLRDRIELQSFTESIVDGVVDERDESAWSTDASLWADVHFLSGSERQEFAQVSPEVTATTMIRYRKGVTSHHRILYRHATTTLDGGVDDTTTSVTVADAIDVPERDPFMALIGSELVEVTAGHGTVNWTATRGANNTTAASHADGATVFVMGVLHIDSVIDNDNLHESLTLNCKELR